MNPRPTSITVLAIIGIILALFGILCAPVGLFGIATEGGEVPLFLPGGLQYVPFPPALNTITIINGVIGFFIGLILLAGSLLSLPLKPAGRTLMNTYAALSILNNVFLSIAQIVLLYPELVSRIEATMTDAPPAAIIIGAILGGIMSMLCQMIYPLCVLYFFNNARAKAAFSGQAMYAQPVYTGYAPMQGGYPPQGWPAPQQNPWDQGQQQQGWPAPPQQPAAPPPGAWGAPQQPPPSWPQQPWQAPADPSQPQYPPPGWPPPEDEGREKREG